MRSPHAPPVAHDPRHARHPDAPRPRPPRLRDPHGLRHLHRHPSGRQRHRHPRLQPPRRRQLQGPRLRPASRRRLRLQPHRLHPRLLPALRLRRRRPGLRRHGPLGTVLVVFPLSTPLPRSSVLVGSCRLEAAAFHSAGRIQPTTVMAKGSMGTRLPMLRPLVTALLCLAAFTALTPNASAVYVCGHQNDASDLRVGDDPLWRSHCTTENINQVNLDCEATVTVTTTGTTYPAGCDSILCTTYCDPYVPVASSAAAALPCTTVGSPVLDGGFGVTCTYGPA